MVCGRRVSLSLSSEADASALLHVADGIAKLVAVSSPCPSHCKGNFSGDAGPFYRHAHRGPSAEEDRVPSRTLHPRTNEVRCAIGTGLGHNRAANSNLSPGACCAHAQPPNWPHRRFTERSCPGPSRLTMALHSGAKGDAEGSRTGRLSAAQANPLTSLTKRQNNQ
jgi:hypothetical protein